MADDPPRTLGQSVEVDPLEALQGVATSAAADGAKRLKDAIEHPDAAGRAVLYGLAADALRTAASTARDLERFAKQGKA